MILKTNDLLKERYRIQDVLSPKGGMGLVYLATDLNLSNAVVIKQSFFGQDFRQPLEEPLPDSVVKTLKNFKDWTDDELRDMQEAFEREAQLLAGLRHPVLPRVFDYFKTAEGGHFLVMEFIDGEDLGDSLDERLRRGQGPFPFEQVCHWADQLLDVLIYLHTQPEQPIIHRDIKPQNLKLMLNGQIILLDFGLAKGARPGMPAQYISVPGKSPGYSPLEQIEERGTNASSDLYSLAMTLHHLLTGQRPPGANARSGSMRIKQPDPLRPAHELNPQIPAAVSDVLQRAAALHQDDRYPSAAAMREALRQAVAVVPSAVTAQPEPELPTSTRPKSMASELKHRIEIAINPRKEELKPKVVEPKPTPPPLLIEDLGNGVKLEMVYIPGGPFLMGSPEGIGDDSERPQHHVTLAPFYLGKYPVTQAQWEALMGSNPSCFKGEQLPVERVSWEEAVKFCERLTQRTRQHYRLPSEAEWEYACRAGAKGEWCFGDDESLLERYAWNAKNSGYETHPVGQKKPNTWGLYDMHGNVWEWCEDDWHDNYNGAPSDGRAWVDISSRARERVMRGGSWNDDTNHCLYCRSAHRARWAPELYLSIIGFRLSRTALEG